MLNENLKPPCRGCDHEFTSKRQPPCDTCLLPGQYADALENKQYPTMDFLRQSKPDHWGTKKDKEKREMVEKSYCKYCEQCKETKLAKDYFDRVAKSPDGFRIICAKCDRENKEKEAEEIVMAIEKGTPIDEKAAAVVIETAKVNPLLMELDFEDREDLYQAICKAAKEELRTPENQLMWWIMNTDPDKMRKGLAGE